ncbi:hypothetical protein CLV72_110263 [Allonocardiopsis opalescens]|uniref:Uncharacterized protein n=1 Tax=Allonocardiopsis opalescens TaxID=1144618 RepID=A0A2T0PUD4_9ACTN|nr:hypothetical protein CLV72_110263 [Allonocardiopsis opalescens]
MRDGRPGFWRSAASDLRIGGLRRQVLFLFPVPLALLAWLVLLVDRQPAVADWIVLIACTPAVAALLLGQLVPVRALPAGLAPEQAARRALRELGRTTALRLWMPMGALAVGFLASWVGGGYLPYLYALALSLPQLWLALPLRFQVDRVRRQLEADGNRSYLWQVLYTTEPLRRPPARVLSRLAERSAAAERPGEDAGTEPAAASAAAAERAEEAERSEVGAPAASAAEPAAAAEAGEAGPEAPAGPDSAAAEPDEDDPAPRPAAPDAITEPFARIVDPPAERAAPRTKSPVRPRVKRRRPQRSRR